MIKHMQNRLLSLKFCLSYVVELNFGHSKIAVHTFVFKHMFRMGMFFFAKNSKVLQICLQIAPTFDNKIVGEANQLQLLLTHKILSSRSRVNLQSAQIKFHKYIDGSCSVDHINNSLVSPVNRPV